MDTSDRMVRADPGKDHATEPRSAHTAELTTGLAPVFDARARVLILGSFPGVASLQASAYYAHPRNQFWPILGALLNAPLPTMPYAERLGLVRSRGIAIWDVVDRCQRSGSLDSAIRDALDNDFEPLLARLPALSAIAFNGSRAARAAPYFTGRGYALHALPSTSPAHASRSVDDKLAAWRALSPWLLPAGDADNGPISGPSPRQPAPD